MAANEPRGTPEERLESLLEEFGALLRASVLRVCGRESGVQPEEVVQDARIRLWRALGRESQITHPASYVVRIATTAAIDALRRVHARREEPLRGGGSEDSGDVGTPPALRAPGPSPEELAAGGEVARKVEGALATLAADRARAVRLHLQGFSSDEIGRLLAWSEPRARNLVHRGLKDLRIALAREGIECEADA